MVPVDTSIRGRQKDGSDHKYQTSISPIYQDAEAKQAFIICSIPFRLPCFVS